MNKENEYTLFEKVDYYIQMKSYMKHNDSIASINDHLGEQCDYNDLKDAEEYQLRDEMRMYRDVLKEKCDKIEKAIEYIKGLLDNTDDFECYGIDKHCKDNLLIILGEDND